MKIIEFVGGTKTLDTFRPNHKEKPYIRAQRGPFPSYKLYWSNIQVITYSEPHKSAKYLEAPSDDRLRMISILDI